MHDPSDPRSCSDDPYRSYGYFDPFEAMRLLKRFENEGIRFQLTDVSGVERYDSSEPRYVLWTTDSARAQRTDRIEIFIHFADEDKARKILDEI